MMTLVHRRGGRATILNLLARTRILWSGKGFCPLHVGSTRRSPGSKSGDPGSISTKWNTLGRNYTFDEILGRMEEEMGDHFGSCYVEVAAPTFKSRLSDCPTSVSPLMLMGYMILSNCRTSSKLLNGLSTTSSPCRRVPSSSSARMQKWRSWTLSTAVKGRCTHQQTASTQARSDVFFRELSDLLDLSYPPCFLEIRYHRCFGWFSANHRPGEMLLR